jgi:protein-tyrosine phosphatase
VSVSAEDFALLQGARNFRAVRSYKADGGRVLRANSIFRSGELSRLDQGDLQVVEALNIKLVCDLRTEPEQAEFVSRWPDAHTPMRLDLPDRGDQDAGQGHLFKRLTNTPGEAGALMAMEKLYRRKPRAYVKTLPLLFDTLLAGDALPVLIHCHAGKDRTGFVIAMLLAALGVSHDDIVEDYVTTAKYFIPAREAKAMSAWAERSFGIRIEPAAAIPMVDARRDYIEASFAAIDEDFGGVAAYLHAAGLDDEKRDQLRDLLLV